MQQVRTRSRWMAVMQWALTLAALAAIGVVLSRHMDDLRGLLALDAVTLIAMSVGAFVLYVANGLVLQALVQHFGTRLPLWETFLLGLMDGTLNYLPMKAGTVATGAYLFSRCSLNPADYTANVVGGSIVNVWVTTTLAGLALVLTGYGPALGAALALLPTLGVVGLIWWSRGRELGPRPEAGRITRTAFRLAEGVRSIMAAPALVTKIVAYNVLRVVSTAFLLYWAFRAVSSAVGVPEVVLLSGLSVIAQRATLLPGGLGVREGGVAGVGALVGIDGNVALAAAVIDRAVQIAVVLVLGLPATAYLSRVLRRDKAPAPSEEIAQ